LKAAWKRCVFSCHWKELNVLDEQFELEKHFHMVRAAAQKERQQKIRLMRGKG